jgi:VanZ family protein
MILLLSFDIGSSRETGHFLKPFLRWLLPWASPVQVDALHALARKVGHITEYALLGAFSVRAMTRGLDWSRRRTAVGAILGCLAVAILDETHQRFLSSRTPSPWDVGIDMVGACLAVAVACGGWRRTVEAITTGLLWASAVGGGLALVVNYAAGVPSGPLWITTPAAVLVLAVRLRLGARARVA